MSALPNPPFVSVDEYLRTAYHPDCEYLDGVVEERYLGEREHSLIQVFLGFLFRSHLHDWSVRAFSDYRVQVKPTRFRVPDITVERLTAPAQSVLRTPPLLAIEILSPEDTLSRLRQRVDDYLDFGVENIWVIDPNQRRVYVADATGFHEPAGNSASAVLTISQTPIEIPVVDLWRELDLHLQHPE